MNNTSLIKLLTELDALSSEGVSCDAQYLEMSFCEDNFGSSDRAVDELKQLDPNNRLCLQYTTLRSSNKKLSISREPFKGVYDDFQSLFNDYFEFCMEGKLDDSHKDFFLIDKTLPCVVEDLYTQFFNLSEWVKLSKNAIGNHHYSAKESVLKFYILEELEDEKKVKTRELLINNALVFCLFEKIRQVPIGFDFRKDENYVIEKKLVLGSTFLKFFKMDECEDVIVKDIMTSPDDFEGKFLADYDFYTKKFSIDKVTREVEKAKVEYLDKVSNIIHDNQAKALAIPVVILGTSLLRAWDIKSALLICTAMALSVYLVALNLWHKRKAIIDCRDSGLKVLGQMEYDGIGDSTPKEHRDIFELAREKIRNKADDALDLFRYIRNGLVVAVLLWSVYLIWLYNTVLPVAKAAGG